MKRPIRKIYLAFIILGLVPLIYTFYEFGSLNANEEIVRKIYQNQLDAILFSVNQSSIDIISSWSNRINNQLESQEALQDTFNIGDELIQLNAVNFLYLSEMDGDDMMIPITIRSDQDQIRRELAQALASRSEMIRRLIDYNEAGYQRREPLDSVLSDRGQLPILFISQLKGGTTVRVVMVLDLPWFIESVLGPRIQAVTQNEFVISVFNMTDDSLIYNSESINLTGETRDNFRGEWQKRDLWLLPGYYLGISLKGTTIDELIQARTIQNLYFLIPLLIMLVGGIIFLFQNIQRELRLAQTKSEFVSNVSHEIRTPLALISMFAETLEMDRVPTEEKKKEYYSIIGKETARLSRIVNRILNFSRIEANKKTYHFETGSLNKLVDGVLESYSYHLESHGFKCEFEKGADLADLSLDCESVEEAVINLLDNAIKYSRDKKSIRIRTIIKGDFQVLEIKDHGIGIPKKYHHELFDQFYRAPIGDVHNTKGSGLGLTIVKKIMEAHHGEVRVESIPDKGSTFSLFFPNYPLKR